MAGRARTWAAIGSLALATACGRNEPLPETAGFGPDPTLPEPHYGLLPPVNTATPIGWRNGATPVAAPGLAVNAFAGLIHPRWLYVLPNGDVLVAQTAGPGEVVKRPKDIVAARVTKAANGVMPRRHRILLLRDSDGDGIAETRTVFLDHDLRSPFGMALVGNDLYVANTDALMRFPYRGGATSIADKGVKVIDLPAGPINHHWTKNVIASRDGARLYVSVGSNSNVGENGMEEEAGRAAIWEVDPKTGRSRIFASGLRNPNGMGWEPDSGALWTVANERDEIGDDLVPDYITSVRDGGFYGWPYSYYGRHVDARAWPKRPDLVARAIRPDYAVGAHTASLGLAFSTGAKLPARFTGGAFIGQHGSWNRTRRSGYKVIFVPFAGGRPSGPPRDVLTGFLSPAGDAQGRPVGVAVDKAGGLLVADDAGNIVWRVSAAR